MQKALEFLKEVREVLREITWPKREALIQLSVVVISISIIVSLFLGGLDYLFTNSIGLFTNLPKNTNPQVSTESATISIAPIEISTPSATTQPTIKPKK